MIQMLKWKYLMKDNQMIVKWLSNDSLQFQTLRYWICFAKLDVYVATID